MFKQNLREKKLKKLDNLFALVSRGWGNLPITFLEKLVKFKVVFNAKGFTTKY